MPGIYSRRWPPAGMILSCALLRCSCTARDIDTCSDAPEESFETSMLQQHFSMQKSDDKADPRDTIADLWLGRDFSEDMLTDLLTKISPRDTSLSQLSANSTGYVVLGSFDTGTNLFDATVRVNFPRLRRTWPIYKHTTVGAAAIEEVMRRSEDQKISDSVLVLMVRSPIANIVGWKKAPYNLIHCANRPYKEMGNPCRTAKYDWTSPDPSTDDPKTFTSTMDVYNTYLRQYNELKEQSKFKHVLMINYEDLVLDPEKVMREFGEACGVNPSETFLTIDGHAKEHGDSVGRSEALQKLRDRSWLDELQLKGLKVLCSGINASLVEDRVEGSHRGKVAQIPYMYDCRNFSA